MSEQKITGVDKLSPDVADMATNWPMIDALVGGTGAMRKAGDALLPKWPYEDGDSYKARIRSATLFPAFTHTASVMAAKPFARPVKDNRDALPAPVKECLDDVDMYGTDLQPYLADLFTRCMHHGLCGVLVDCPPTDGKTTMADQKSAGIRPYFTTYPAPTILGWRAERSAKGSRLTQLRLMESVKTPDGEFAEKPIAQVRVLEPGRWRTFRKSEQQASANGAEWVLHDSGETSLDRIPFVFFYGIRRGFGIGLPPLLDLAYLNVEHWQSSSDQQTILHVARVPVLFAKGFGDHDVLVIGAAQAAKASNVDADLRYVEHSGSAIGAGRDSLNDLEERMRQIGAELLVIRPGRITATQVQSENDGNRSTLQKIAEDFEESAEQCINLMGEWTGSPCEAEVELFKDFSATHISDAANDLLLRAVDAEVISRETAFTQLQRADIVSPDISFDDEKQRLAAQPKIERPAVQVPPAAA